jgi:ribose transport system permease protein
VGIVALGLMFIIISGGIDLSAGFGVALSIVCTGMVFGFTKNIVLAIIASIVVGMILGTLNAVIITRIGLQPFIVTLATMSIAQGLTQILSTGQIVFFSHPVLAYLGRGRILHAPTSTVILLVLYAIGYLILNYTKLGAYTFALGDNEEGARLAGIPINRYKTILYIMSGVCMGMAAIIIISRIALVAANLAGVSLLLDAVASVILGGTSINGGSGTVEGTLIGVVLVGMISNALNLLNVPPVFQDVFKGGVIILALYYQVLTRPARTAWKR